MILFYNGQFVKEEELKIPYNDRGFLFGDGVFTTVLVREGRAEWVERHFERLRSHCKALQIEPPEFSGGHIEELIRVNHAEQGTWRLKIVVTGGSSEALNLQPRRGTCLMFLAPYQIIEAPVTLCIYPEPIERPLSKLKTLAYLDRLLVKEYARQQGADDAIVTTKEGYWLETAFSNLFWRHESKLYTPKLDQPLLAGIALQIVMEMSEVEQLLTKEVPKEAQLFVCNALIGSLPAFVM